MTLQINRILNDEYITNILNFIFVNRPVKIIRTIARTGVHASSVPWLYYTNEITGQRFATFISLQDLLSSFWVWLESINIFAIAFNIRKQISKIVYHFLNVGDHIFSLEHGWAYIVKIETSAVSGHLQLWIETEKDSRIEIVEPCKVEIF